LKIELVLFVVLATFCVTLASGTITTFKTGPFTGSVDLGMPCNHTNISKPVSSEDLGGAGYTNYIATICTATIAITRYDKDIFNLTTPFGTSSVNRNLLKFGADKDTIKVYDREINSQSGAVGSGYISKSGLTLYAAGSYVSPKSVCRIYLTGNQTEMISILKTIHVTEAA
jgi:hypothetical protein